MGTDLNRGHYFNFSLKKFSHCLLDLPLDSMQKARQEANEAFKNIKLGQKRKASVTEKKTGLSPVTENAKKRVTRLERCKLEAQNAFGNAALSDIGENVDTRKSFGRASVSRMKKEQRKSTSKGRQNRRSSSRRRSLRRKSSTKGSRITRVQAAQLEALRSFGGQGLDNVWKSGKTFPTCSEHTETTNKEEVMTDTREPAVSNEVAATEDEGTTDVSCQSVLENNIFGDSLEVCMISGDTKNTCQEENDLVDDGLSNEKAVEFSSEKHCQLVDESTQIYEPIESELPAEDPKSNKMSNSVVQDQNASALAADVQPCDSQMHSTKEMCPFPDQSHHQSSVLSNDMQCSSAVCMEPKPVTRLEKARLEALQSFHGQAFDQVIKSSSRKMAKYLTPVKHQGTNTEVNQTRNTPSQTEESYCRRYPRPKSSFYTSLRDNSFYDRDALLESSKMVVLTARTLDTPSPDCSPANASNP